MNQTIESLLNHRSIRSYTHQPVEEEKIDLIIRAAQAAPNWCNIQHVSIIAVQDAQHREKLAELCGQQEYIAQAPVFLIFCADFYRTALACRQYGQSMDTVMDKIDNVIVGANDVGIALGTAVAAAESLGLGTVPIGDVRLNAFAITQDLNLPRYVIPMIGLCVGYAAENPSIRPRLPKQAVYFSEHYQSNLNAVIEQYDQQYARYLKEREWNSRDANWTQSVANFYRPPYNHYPEIPALLKQQGFLYDNQED
ncbi:NADPH-dependent oxidoreductase [Gallibacterium salpingitidis]|uniref:FMN reductase n=1 Tax=Gallibacterium salpingitidis TaxID=505341 RepID=A0A1A7NZS3_9PAST|nr:NADPH-dependent oxidoreductase [Gallibacterium salpingitidis]OBW95213.1 FMN reductase [Gallibacterium salpingitidis]